MAHKALSKALFTDLYQLTMAQAYWWNDRTAEATFSLYFRNLPPDRGYLVFAGLGDALEYLETFQLTGEDIAHLRSLDLFDKNFLSYLADMRFTGSVRAMAEGSIFFAGEPVLEVTAPVIEAQITETFLVNQVHLQTLLATKAARVVHAAREKTVVDFAARRTHGADAADAFARASYMAGFAGTSNVLAGGRYGIPTYGTMGHSFVTTFDDEGEAFRAYGNAFPDTSTFLVDTYDSLEGTRRAIEVAKEMRERGHWLRSIRLDSGDLANLSAEARVLLDEAGLGEVRILASGGLDEFKVNELFMAGAPIDGFGVGTKVGVSSDTPWGDIVYKLVEYGGNPVLKLSTGKETLPGRKQVYRYADEDGSYARDVITIANSLDHIGAALLAEVMRHGERRAVNPTVHELREHFARELARLPGRYKGLTSPASYPVEISADLETLRSRIALETRRR